MNDADVQIREFRFPEDYEQVINIWAGAGDGVHLGRSDTAEQINNKIRRDPDLFLVAENSGNLVGAVLGGFDGRRGLIYHLAVAREYRKRGIGARLMDELEQRLREKGCLKIYLLVTRDNHEAMRFYAKRGWNNMSDLFIFGKELT